MLNRIEYFKRYMTDLIRLSRMFKTADMIIEKKINAFLCNSWF